MRICYGGEARETSETRCVDSLNCYCSYLREKKKYCDNKHRTEWNGWRGQMVLIDIQTERHSGDYSVFIHHTSHTSTQIDGEERVAEAHQRADTHTREREHWIAQMQRMEMVLRNDAFNFVVLVTVIKPIRFIQCKKKLIQMTRIVNYG